ncbi:MAG: dihydropteroate synthase, partial [Alphaproteobacteria bacterium]
DVSGGADDTVRLQWAGLTESRSTFAGLDLSAGPRIMAIVNATPDSFSDAGDQGSTAAAIGHGLAMAEAGAQIIDVGGESTRPGADPVSPEAECRRVVPVVTSLAERGLTVSIDTRRAMVMATALAAGATIINDVHALGGQGSMAVAAQSGAHIVLMHMQGEPKTMQAAPDYAHILLDIYDFLEARIESCSHSGIDRRRLCIDPGIGFGKTAGHNFTLIAGLAMFHGLGCPLLLGASRKSFIAHAAPSQAESPPKARLGGSIAAALAAADRGVQFLRVHDVAQTQQALAVRAAITLARA